MKPRGNKGSRPWKEDEINQLIEMRDVQGMTFREIGFKLKRPRNSCEYKYNVTQGFEAMSDKTWPPTSDPWSVKIDFASENYRIPSGKYYVTRTDHGEVRSLVGTTLG